MPRLGRAQPIRAHVARPAGTSANTLLAGLAAYYPLDEPSGNAIDSLGANPLTDSGSVGTAAGQINTARTFDGSSQSFGAADNATFSTGDVDFTFSAWVYLTDKSAIVRNILTKRQGGVGGFEYAFRYYNAPDRFSFFVSTDGNVGGIVEVTANNFGSPSLSTWYLVVATHDPVADQIAISVNAGTPDTASVSGGVFDGTADFRIGASSDLDPEYWQGRIDEVGFWKPRVLTSADLVSLYNGGSGLPFPAFGPAPPVISPLMDFAPPRPRLTPVVMIPY